MTENTQGTELHRAIEVNRRLLLTQIVLYRTMNRRFQSLHRALITLTGILVLVLLALGAVVAVVW